MMRTRGRCRLLALAVCAGASGPAAGQVTAINSPNPSAGGAFGQAVAMINDVSGDGREDILVGAPNEGQNTSGRVHVVLGFVGAILRVINAPNPKTHAEFGAAVTGIDDMNSDGFPDIAVGAPGVALGTTPAGSGRVYIFSGATTQLLRVQASPGMELDGNFGHAVAGIGDINGDLVGDILIGGPFEDPGSSPDGCGRAYVVSGVTGQLLRKVIPAFAQVDGNFGIAVAGLSDVNGDAVDDYMVGSLEFSGEGRVHVYSGATGARLRTLQSPGKEADGMFGWSVSGVPDVNGDAIGDIVAGAPGESPGASPAGNGRAYIYSGATGMLLRKLLPLTPEVDGNMGWSVAGMPDTNGDTFGDVVVGAPGEDPGTSVDDAGRVYVFSGATGARLATLQSQSEEVFGEFGLAVTGLPDQTGNLRAEVVAGAPGELFGGLVAGRAFLIRR